MPANKDPDDGLVDWVIKFTISVVLFLVACIIALILAAEGAFK